MPLAKDVASELRKLADRLDPIGDQELRAPWINFYHTSASGKDPFLRLVEVLPRPLAKTYESGEYGDVILTYEAPAVRIRSSIMRSAVCRLVEPAQAAVYECEPLLTQDEDAEIVEARK